MVLFADFPGAALMFVLALGVAIWILLRRSRRYQSRQSSRPIARFDRPQPHDPDSDKIPPGELTRWEVQMHETARDLLAELETKAAMLQQLIRDADRAAARLERAREAAGVDPAAENQAQGLTSAADAAHPADGRPESTTKGRHEEIYTLADYVFPASEIAHRLDTPVGEVELILALRDKDR